MPLSIAERVHRMPHGAQIEVAADLGVSDTYVSLVMRGEYPAKTEPTRERVRAVQCALAAKLELPVWEVFEEWDGARPAEDAQLSDDEKWERFRQKQARAS